jgi:hypothetical protein
LVSKRAFVYFGFDSKIIRVFGKSYLLPFNADKPIHLMPSLTKITNIYGTNNSGMIFLKVKDI